MDWRSAVFETSASFTRVSLIPKTHGQPSAVFSRATFLRPKDVSFSNIDLSRALFLDCDATQLSFSASVTWGSRKARFGSVQIYEEVIPLGEPEAAFLRRGADRDYRAVAQVYQQLKKNYDSALDYWAADEFHFGEMEMRRIGETTRGPLFRYGWIRRYRKQVPVLRNVALRIVEHRVSLLSLSRECNLTAWYRRASNNGNSFVKPLTCMVMCVITFGLLFPWIGVNLATTGAISQSPQSYRLAWHTNEPFPQRLGSEAKLAGKGVVVSLETATLQKNGDYRPLYPWGQLLAILETLSIATLFALFLLAVRRRFRR